MEELAGYSPADLFQSLGPEPPVSALFTTFTFSPGAFQHQYLTPLLQHGYGDIVVMADPIGYAQSLFGAASVQGVGTDYRLRQIAVRGAFHGKLVLVRTRSTMIVGVGSGNLTASGLQTNAEVGGLYVIDNPESLKQLDSLQQRLRGMALLATPEQRPSTAVKLTDDARLLTSLDAPILDQVDVPEDVRRIEIVSPFVDTALEALGILRDLWPNAKIRLRLDPGFGSLGDGLLSAVGEYVEVLVPIEKSDGENERRPAVHGKLICLVGEHSATVILGSGNLSRRALMSTDNFEVVIERRCTPDMIDGLLAVPQTQWRPARTTDRVHVPFESPPQAVRPLVATLTHRDLSIEWISREHTHGMLRLWGKGRCIHEQRVEADVVGSNSRSTSTLLSDAIRAAVVGPCFAELSMDDGSLFRGWIEIIDLLDLPPESKRQFAVLDDIASDPAACHTDEVVKFVELLQRSLMSNSGRAWYSAAKNRPAGEFVYDEVSVPRSQLLDLTPLDQDEGTSLLSSLLNRTLDGALRDLRFFNRDNGEEVSQPSEHVSEADPSNGRTAPKSTRALPVRIEEVLRQLFRQLGDAIESSRTPHELLARISQIPTCVKALAFAIARWLPGHRERDILHHYLNRVVIFCMAPGVASSVQRQGAVLRLLTTPQEYHKTRHVLNCGVAILEAYILFEVKTGKGTRPDILRDMHDVLRRLPPVDSLDLQEAACELWLLQDTSTDVMPDPLEVRKELESAQGELANLRACRAALVELISAWKRGIRSEAILQDLVTRACGHDPAMVKAIAVRALISTSAGQPQLIEIDSGEHACPKCYTTLPTAAHSRLRDSTTIHRCTCGRLLVRSLDR